MLQEMSNDHMRKLIGYGNVPFLLDVTFNGDASYIITRALVDSSHELKYCVMMRDQRPFWKFIPDYDAERDPRWIMLYREVIMSESSLSKLCMKIAIDGNLKKKDVVIGSMITSKADSDMIMRCLE